MNQAHWLVAFELAACLCLLCVSSIVTDNARRSAGEQEIIIPFLHPPFLSFPWGFSTCPFHTPESLSPPSKCSATWSLAKGQPSPVGRSWTEIRPLSADKTSSLAEMMSWCSAWSSFRVSSLLSGHLTLFALVRKKNFAASKENKLKAKTKSGVAGHSAAKLAVFRPFLWKTKIQKQNYFSWFLQCSFSHPSPSPVFIRTFSLHSYGLWH